jgi:hypothetical protein
MVITSLKGASMNQVDAIYNSGMETAIAQARAIVTGPVTGFAKHILQSDAASGTPLRWEVQGEIREARALKGEAPPAPIRFTRAEQALFIPQPEMTQWEADYLQFQTGDRAVVYITGIGVSSAMRVYPSGSDERDLAAQVSRIAAIQSIQDPAARFEAWRNDLGSVSSMEERQAVLRALVSFRKPWSEMLPVLEQAMAPPNITMRSFVFGLIGYGIRQEIWPGVIEPAAFLCGRLQSETSRDLTLRYQGVLRMLLNFAGEQDHKEDRKSLRDLLDHCLQ